MLVNVCVHLCTHAEHRRVQIPDKELVCRQIGWASRAFAVSAWEATIPDQPELHGRRESVPYSERKERWWWWWGGGCRVVVQNYEIKPAAGLRLQVFFLMMEMERL